MQQWLGASPSRSRELRRSMSRLELIHSKNLRIGEEQTMQPCSKQAVLAAQTRNTLVESFIQWRVRTLLGQNYQKNGLQVDPQDLWWHLLNTNTYGKICQTNITSEHTETTDRHRRVSRQSHMFGDALPHGWHRQFPGNQHLPVQRCMPHSGWRQADPGQMERMDMRMYELC